MSSAAARFLFIFLFVIQCVLWSQSRYAQLPHSSLNHGEKSLVKRISDELLNPNAVSTTDNFGHQCKPLAQPVYMQCAHVQQECAKSNTVLSINYLRHYFCTSPPLRPLMFCALVIWLIFLFSTLGISASDFFTPNLATIAQLLGLDDDVAGVTFLAFGNGSPDVFSTFSAMRAGSGSLAIGELLGAATFIVSCVVGSMCIIKPFTVHRGPFLRDVGFFTVAVTLLLVILQDGTIHPWEAVVMVAMYMFYVAAVVFGSWWERRQEVQRQADALRGAEFNGEPLDFQEPYRDNPSPPQTPQVLISVSPPSPELPRTQTQQARSRAISTPQRPRLQTDLPPRPHSRNATPTGQYHTAQFPSFSLIGALEFHDVVASLRHQAAASSLSMFEGPVTPFAGGHYHRHSQRTPRTSLSSHDEDPFDQVALGAVSQRVFDLTEEPDDDDRSSQTRYRDAPDGNRSHLPYNGHLDPTHSGRFDDPHSSRSTTPSIVRTPATPTISDGDTDSQVYVPLTRWQQFISVLGCIVHTLLPSLHHFRSQSILAQIASIFAAPAVMALTLTLPVVVTPYHHSMTSREKLFNGDGRLVDFEEEGEERVLIAEEEVLEDMHEMSFNKWLTASQCAIAPVFCAAILFNGTRHLVPLLIASAVGGIASAILVAVFADKGEHPAARMARCWMGFLVAIIWIMAIADEVVNVLQTFGHIFGLSDAIIGLTIFAMGNSLADLVANMSVAVFAPIMGFSACFGGPMLNILLGVGISGTYIIQQTSSPYELHFSTTLLVSGFGLLSILAATLIFVPLNGYLLTRGWGFFLVASYTVFMIINVIVELKTEA